MISIIVPCSHMAHIDSGAEVHIKEDSIITIITIEDAITDIIALLAWILFCTLTEAEQRNVERNRLCCERAALHLFNCLCWWC